MPMPPLTRFAETVYPEKTGLSGSVGSSSCPCWCLKRTHGCRCARHSSHCKQVSPNDVALIQEHLGAEIADQTGNVDEWELGVCTRDIPSGNSRSPQAAPRQACRRCASRHRWRFTNVWAIPAVEEVAQTSRSQPASDPHQHVHAHRQDCGPVMNKFMLGDGKGRAVSRE